MGETVEIQLCMGSSCFARGNSAFLETLEDLIKANGWENSIRLSGLHCQNLCSEGPNIKIDGQLHQGLDMGALLDILEGKLGTGADGTGPARYASVRRTTGKGS